MASEQAPAGSSTGGGLPVPTGSYPVGRMACHWRDASRNEESTALSQGGRRELVGWIWYPAAQGSDAQPATYLPAGWEALGQFWGFQPDDARGHAYLDAPIAADHDRYPVLLFSPAGFPPLSLAAILEEVASHGYVVVGINHTSESTITVFPDGRVVPMDAARMQPVFGPYSGPPEETMRGRAAIADDKAADVRFVVDQLAAMDAGTGPLAGRLDLDRIAAFGHSLGGNAALEYARLDSRCKAAVNLDGGIWNEVGKVGLDRPVLQILADHVEMVLPCEEAVRMGIYPTVAWCEVEQRQAVGGWQRVYERSQPSYAVLIRGSGHISFLDVPFLPIQPGSLLAGGLAGVTIDRRRAWRIICDYLLAFFGRHLDGAATPLLDGPSAAYPEVVVGAPRDLLAGETGR
jgi:hypothetical protein